jgi:hypothetical protein
MKETRKQKIARQRNFAAGLAADRVCDPIRTAIDTGELVITPGATMSDQPLQRVQIVNRKHPHFEEYGRFTGKIITLVFNRDKPLAEVKLEHCCHGVDACFVSQGDVIAVKERP